MNLMMRRTVLVALAALAAACSLRNVGCRMPEPQNAEQAGDPAAQAPAAAAAEPGAPSPRTIEIVFLGDSLTAGMGLLSQQAFPALIESDFEKEGYSVEAINAGISGDTSAGGLRRVDGLLTPRVKILVLALGANDALRGLTVTQTRDNLSAIIRAAQAKGVSVVVCGMEAPTNYGDDYRTAFRDVFLRIGMEFKNSITYVPFLLEGVAGNPAMNQADGIHPNEQGARVIADMLYPRIRTVVDSIGGGG